MPDLEMPELDNSFQQPHPGHLDKGSPILNRAKMQDRLRSRHFLFSMRPRVNLRL